MADIPKKANPQKNTEKKLDRLTGIIINERYEILQRIASGGMADVYTGQDLKLKKKVAIKILQELYSDSVNFTARFEKEAQILSKLKSPNIISIYDFGKYGGLYYIIMEFISGSSLKELIEARGAFEPQTAASYAIQICNALELAHDNNLIHRDIKPQNILINKEEILKVTDFGIAKSTSGDITKTINILGTAHYLSPEQAQGKILDNRTDIYSLGILIYEMLVSDVPFRGGSSIDISIRHISERPQPPSAIIKDIPARLEEIVMRCLEKNPEDRYPDIVSLKEDLQDYLSNKPAAFEKFKKNGFKKNIARSNRTGSVQVNEFHYGKYINKTGSKGAKNFSDYKNIVIGLLSASIIFCILFFIFLSMFLVSNSRFNKISEEPQLIEVPQLQNTEINSAIKILSNIGLEILADNNYFDEAVPENFIIKQTPGAGTLVEKNTEIYVTVSKGTEIVLVEVPNLISLNMDDAEKILEDLDLNAGEISEEYNDAFKKGEVTRQNPPPLTSVEKNTTINLTLSKGRQLITIPDFKGYDYFFARANLEALDLVVYTKRKTAEGTAPGKVIGMDPPEGSSVYENSSVTIFISTNEQLISVPYLINLDLGTAIQMLDSLNIPYEISYVKVDYSIQEDYILAQFPEPQEQVLPNDGIILFVGQRQ